MDILWALMDTLQVLKCFQSHKLLEENEAHLCDAIGKGNHPQRVSPLVHLEIKRKKVSALGRVFAAVVTIFLVLYPISLNSIPATILYPYPEVPIEGHFI